MIRVLHTIPSLHPKVGGPARSVTTLVAALNRRPDMRAIVVTQQIKNEPIFMNELPAESVSIARLASRGGAATGAALVSLVGNEVERFRPDIIHDHGLWKPAHQRIWRLSNELKIPVALHTRGMLMPGALDQKKVKKKIAYSLYQKRLLERVNVLVATSEPERASLRSLGLTQPIAVVPNAIQPIEIKKPGKSETKISKRILFLGRIHPIKGISLLLEAWALVRTPGWSVTLAGPDEDGYVAKVKRQISSLGLEGSVFYVGEVNGSAKAELLCDSDLFVMPSISENFGLSIAEALSYGLPVITTHGTPWEAIASGGCGWWVEYQLDAFVSALKEATSLSEDDILRMKSKGLKLSNKYQSGPVAEAMSRVYRWITDGGELPTEISLD